MKQKVTAMLIVVMLLMGSLGIGIANANVVEISVQDVWADTLVWGRVWLQTIDLFEQSHPNIKIKRNFIPIGQNIERVLLQTRTRSLPDIITSDVPDVPHLAASGALMDLSQFVDDWGHWEDILPGSRSAGTWNDKPYAVQFSTNTIALHYNKDLFEEAGLTRAPETWEELEIWAEKLTVPAKGQYGFAYSAINTEEATWQFAPFLWSNGGDLLDLNQPEAIEALEFYTGFVKRGHAPRDVVNWNQGDVGVQFRLGKVAMMVQGSWDIPLSEEEGVNFGIAKLPVPKAGLPLIAPVGGETFSISPFSSPEKQQAAWTFLEWLLEGEGHVFFNRGVNNIPTRTSLAPRIISDKPLLRPFLDQLATGRNRSEYGAGALYPQVSAATREAIQSVIIGQSTPERAFENAARTIADAVK